MRTLLAKQNYCGFCGASEEKDGLQLLVCPCRRINFCGVDCQRKAIPEHRLICTEYKRSNSKFLAGDIVEISGLQSEVGQSWNGCMAEVLEDRVKHSSRNFVGDRVPVMLAIKETTREGNIFDRIKTASLKAENLAVKLTVLAAAKAAARIEDEELPTGDFDSEQEMATTLRLSSSLAEEIDDISGKEIVRRVLASRRSEGIRFLQAMGHKLGDFRFAHIEDMFLNGLTHACFSMFKFPEAIDLDSQKESACSTLILSILANLLSGETVKDANELSRLSTLRADVMRGVGPTLLVVTTKKRRLFRRAEGWWILQWSLSALLSNCFIAGPEVTNVFTKELDPSVLMRLRESVVSWLTVDPCVFLQNKSHIITNVSEIEIEKLRLGTKMRSVRILFYLMGVNECHTRLLGETVVPGGAPRFTGRTFAESFLDIVSVLAVDVDTWVRKGYGTMPYFFGNISFVYDRMVNSPFLLQLMDGEVDNTFVRLESGQALLIWAKIRIARWG